MSGAGGWHGAGEAIREGSNASSPASRSTGARDIPGVIVRRPATATNSAAVDQGFQMLARIIAGLIDHEERIGLDEECD